MKIEKVIQEDHQARITVEFTSAKFEGYKRRAAKKISRDVKIDGFRSGKAPYNFIVSKYGEGAVIQEAIDLILDEEYPKILDEAEITPSGAGSLESIESYDPPKFIFLVPLEPDVTLGDYHEIRKDYSPEPFDETEVDEFIENMRRNAATIIPSEEPAGEGSLVYFTLSGEFLNPADDEDATITDKTPQQVVIPEKAKVSENEWPFSGFARELLGVNAGDTKEIEHTYPDDYQDETFQGKTAIFTIDVQSVKALELPEFDEEFIKDFGEYESTDAFREDLDNRMRQEKQEEYDQAFFEEILEEVLETSELKYPPQMLEHEAEHVLEDIKNRLAQQNLDFETYLKLRETDEETFMAEEINPTAKKRLERSLIINALVESEALKVDQAQLQQNINQLLGELFYSGNYQEMQKQMGQEEFSRAISMEGVSRTVNAQLQERMKLIVTGQPIPEDEPEEASEESDLPDTEQAKEDVSAEVEADDTELSSDDVDEDPAEEDVQQESLDESDEESDTEEEAEEKTTSEEENNDSDSEG